MSQIFKFPDAQSKNSDTSQSNNHDKIVQNAHTRASFDFDYWCELFQSDPSKFESSRREVILQLISSRSTDKQVLHDIQKKIDSERDKHAAPLGSCYSIYSMMLDFFLDDFTYSVNQYSQKVKSKYSNSDFRKTTENSVAQLTPDDTATGTDNERIENVNNQDKSNNDNR